jgi:hypothetical protein
MRIPNNSYYVGLYVGSIVGMIGMALAGSGWLLLVVGFLVLVAYAIGCIWFPVPGEQSQ